VMQDVSDKLLGQFVACLEERFVAQPEPAAEEAASADARAGDDVQDGLSGGTPGAAAGTGAAAAGASRAGFTAGTPSAPHPGGARRAASSDDALDLGATVLPVLLKSYWKQAAGVILVLLVLKKLLSRSRS